jgi:adenylate kinase
MFKDKKHQIVVLSFEVSLNQLMDRLLGRRICEKCNSVFHIITKPPIKDNRCDICSHSPLIQREDDNKKSIQTRFDIYQEKIEPIKEVLSKFIVSIDADKNPKEVFNIVKEYLLLHSAK